MKSLGSKSSYLSPLATGLILSVIIASGGIDVTPPANAEVYFARSAEAIDSIPYRIGSWLGDDQPITRPAQELLKPNAALQRRFTNSITGEQFSLLVVQCKSTRDMQGHYPPICYDRHGWLLTESSEQDISLDDSGMVVPSTRYRFERISDRDQIMIVFNVFVVPTSESPFAGDIEALDRASRGRSSAGMGAAQIQVIVGPGLSREEELEVITMVLQEIRSELEVLAEGNRDE